MLPFQARSSLEKPQKRVFATCAVYVTVISGVAASDCGSDRTLGFLWGSARNLGLLWGSAKNLGFLWGSAINVGFL